MTSIKIFILTIVFFTISFMLGFVDYIIRLSTNDSIYYTALLFLVFSFASIYLLLKITWKFIDFKLLGLKILFTILVIFIGISRFYNEFYFFVSENLFIIVPFILCVIVVSLIYITILINIDKKERYVFIGYFFFVIILNTVIQLLNYDYNFNYVSWTILAFKSVLLLMTYYYTAKFFVTNKDYKIMISCYTTILIIFAFQSMFAIILYFS